MGIDIPNHDAMLDDPLHRYDIAREELETWQEEMGLDDAYDDMDAKADDVGSEE